MSNTFAYNIQSRKSKKGIVYDVYFYVQTYEGRKQKKLSGFRTKSLAKRAYEQYMEHYISTPIKYDGKSVVSYESARKQYLNAIKQNVKVSSLYDFMHTGAKHYDVFFAGKNLMTMTKQDIYAFQDFLWTQKKPDKTLYSQAALSKIYHQFTAFYRWCIERYNVPNVLAGVSMPKRREQRREYTIWTQQDFEKFIACVDNPKYIAVFTTLFYCGMRVGELEALTPSDYDSQTARLYIHQTLSRKTIRGEPYLITETKNYKARYIPLPKRVVDTINDWIDYKDKEKIGKKYLFGNNAPLSLSPIDYALKKYTQIAGVPKIRIHDLRHSYVSLLMSKGANFGVIASLIGDTLDQVIKTYAHHTEEDQLAVVSNI